MVTSVSTSPASKHGLHAHSNEALTTHHKRPAAILGFGPAGNGKTTLLNLIFETICSKRSEKQNAPVVRVEMSKIILWGKGRHGPLGKLVDQHIHLIAQGRYLPDEVINPLLAAWMDEHQERHSSELYIIGGLPRTVGQLTEVKHRFSRIAAIMQPVDQETSFRSIRERWHKAKMSGKAGELRPDDAGGESVLEERWSEHCLHTPHIVSKLNGALINLDRSVSLTARLTEVFKKLKEMNEASPIPTSALRKCITRLGQGNHPIHSLIKEVESPKPRAQTEITFTA